MEQQEKAQAAAAPAEGLALPTAFQDSAADEAAATAGAALQERRLITQIDLGLGILSSGLALWPPAWSLQGAWKCGHVPQGGA